MYKIILPFMLRNSAEVLFAAIRELIPTDQPLFKPDNAIAILASEFDGKKADEVYNMIHDAFRKKEEAEKNAVHFTQNENGKWEQTENK